MPEIAESLARAGQTEQAKGVTARITTAWAQVDALTRVADVLARTGQQSAAEIMARSITAPDVLSSIARSLAEAGAVKAASRVAAAACAAGDWSFAARAVLLLTPTAWPMPPGLDLPEAAQPRAW